MVKNATTTNDLNNISSNIQSFPKENFGERTCKVSEPYMPCYICRNFVSTKVIAMADEAENRRFIKLR